MEEVLNDSRQHVELAQCSHAEVEELMRTPKMSESDDSQSQITDILQVKSPKIDRKFVMCLKSEEELPRDAKNYCKILKYNSCEGLEEVNHFIGNLNPEEYPRLYAFIVETKEAENLEKLQESLQMFSIKRPLLLQLTLQHKKVTKFFYKKPYIKEFEEIDTSTSETIEESTKGFQSFFKLFLSGNLLNFLNENAIESTYRQILIDPLSSRLFRSLYNVKDDLKTMADLCFKYESKDHLFTLLDIPFDDDDRVLSREAWNVITSMYFDWDDDINKSSLRIAVEHKNDKIAEYLVTNFGHFFILEYEEELEISTKTYQHGNFDLLCDMLNICDFPFPKGINFKDINHERLSKIIEERIAFHAAVEAGDLDKISELTRNSNLKVIYNPQNESALRTAIKFKHFSVYFHLMSVGFRGSDVQAEIDDLNSEHKSEMRRIKRSKISENIKLAYADVLKTPLLLAARSGIHSPAGGNDNSEEHQKNIETVKRWFLEIYKVPEARPVLDVCAKCDKLLIRFDFGADHDGRILVCQSQSLGSMLPNRYLIIIGAKITPENTEEDVKGTLSHEMSHYANKTVFENKEEPYYENDPETAVEYAKLVDEYEIYEKQDDECQRIISRVYDDAKDAWKAELIVRVPQICVTFDPQTVEHLSREKFSDLFGIYKEKVIPELEAFDFDHRKCIRDLISTAGRHPSDKNMELELKSFKVIENLLKNQFGVVRTNIKELFLVHICKFIQTNFKGLARYIVAGAENFADTGFRSKFHEAQRDFLTVIVDCSEDDIENVTKIKLENGGKFVFIAASEDQSRRVADLIKKMIPATVASELKLLELEVNYDWESFTISTQQKLLETEVNFQSTIKKISDILNGPQAVEAFDTYVLNQILCNSQINLNIEADPTIHEQDFNLLYFHPRYKPPVYRPRIRNYQYEDMQTDFEHLSLDEIVNETKSQKFVLLSDNAGLGKSWTMKKLAQNICGQEAVNWVTYVDLKKFTEAFKSLESSEDFLECLAKNILKFSSSFEENVFRFLYRTGKVYMLFDGFDEIAPNYAENVVNLIKSFEFNDGNHLWVATRELFEVDLQKIIQTDPYKHLNFWVDAGIQLILRIWTLNEIRKEGESKIALKDIEQHDIYKNSFNLAFNVHDNITKEVSEPLPPLMYRMAGELTKDDRNSVKNKKFNKFNFYDGYVKQQYEIWQNQKGPIRKDISTQKNTSVSPQLNYMQAHMLVALKLIFPDQKDFCDLNEKLIRKWTEIELTGCGLMYKSNSTYYFIHKSYAEFLTSKFIIENLRENNQDILDFLIPAIFDKKYEEVMSFLAEGLAQSDVLKYLDNDIQSQLIAKLESSLDDNAFTLQSTMLYLLEFGFDVKFLSKFIAHLSKKTKIVMKLSITCKLRNEAYGNLLSEMCRSKLISMKMIQDFLDNLSEAIGSDSVIKIMTNSFENIFPACVASENSENLEFFWTSLTEHFGMESFGKYIKNVLIENDQNRISNFLFRWTRECKDIKIHKILWSILSLVYDKNELKSELVHSDYIWNAADKQISLLQFVLEKVTETFDKSDLTEVLSSYFTPFQFILNSTKKLENFKLLWEIVKTLDDPMNILTARNDFDSILIHLIAELQSFQVIEFVFNELKSDIVEANPENSKKNRIKNLLISINDQSENFFYLIMSNENITSRHMEYLWTIAREYFSDVELLELIKSSNNDGKNLVLACFNSKNETIDDCWKEVTEVVENLEFLKDPEHVSDMIWECEDIIHKKELNDTEIEHLKLEWIEIDHEKMFLKVFEQLTTEKTELSSTSASQTTEAMPVEPFSTTIDFIFLARCPVLEIHEKSWQFLLENTTKDSLSVKLSKQFLGKSFVNEIILNSNPKVVSLTFEKIRKNFNENEMMKIYSINSKIGKNLIQKAAVSGTVTFTATWNEIEKSFKDQNKIEQILLSKTQKRQTLFHILENSQDLSLHKIIWKVYKQNFPDRTKLIKILTQKSFKSQHFLEVLASSSPFEIFENAFSELEELMSISEIQKEFGDGYDIIKDPHCFAMTRDDPAFKNLHIKNRLKKMVELIKNLSVS